jgi:predicted PolB exonuclease-like 3'-5' exonuclease
MNTITFDIETGASSRAEIAELKPDFEAPSNWKDPDKIRAYIEAKEADWHQQAALSATTGRVLSIGYIEEGGEFRALASGDEASDIAAFWNVITHYGAITHRLVGFNSNSFDLPFLIRRSWKLGIRPPATLMSGRYLNHNCVDLLDLWRCGNREDRISLDKLARFLGIGGKNGNGAEFASLFSMNREAALRYLENDVLLTRRCAQVLGVL